MMAVGPAEGEGVVRDGPGNRLRSSRLVQNTAALYAVHLSGLALPLITFPFLARVLRPDGWGLVLFCQAFAMWLALIVEYGFNLSGTRAVAALRDDRERSGHLVAEILGAKALLAAATAGCGVLAYISLQVFREQPHYLVVTCLYGIALGFNPIWYFQGVERMRAAAGTDVGLKAGATAAIFLLVREPSDGWIVLGCYGAAGLLWTVIGTIWIYRELPFYRPGMRGITDLLKQSSPLFAFRGVSGVYSQAAPLVLGTLTSATVVAYFAGAERLIRAATGLIQPVSQAFFPRLSYLFGRDRDASAKLLRASLVTILGLGLIVGIGTYIVAPHFVPILLGPGYEESVSVLRLLSVVPPIVAFATVLGFQWALPAGHDRPLLSFVVVAAFVSLGAAQLLVPEFGASGMAAAVILAEATVLAGLVWLAHREGLSWSPAVKRRPLTAVGAAVGDRESLGPEPMQHFPQ